MPTEATLMAAAQALGTAALPGFFVTLTVLLIAVGWIGRSLQRHGPAGAAARRSSAGILVLRFTLGFALIAGAAFAFAGIAGEIGTGEQLGRLDEAYSAAVRHATSERTVQVFAWITRLGDPPTLTVLGLVVAGALALRGEYLLTLGWAGAIAGNAILNPILKNAFERVRPVHNADVTLATGWSFPSGHSSGAVVAYGMLAYVLIRTLPAAWHLPVTLLATALAFTTGCSRIFLQAHYASDVAAGFASGAAWLAICIAGVELIRLNRSRQR